MSRSCLPAVVLAFVGTLSTLTHHVRAQSSGPDLITGDLWDKINHYGPHELGSGMTAYAVGTRACNMGDEEVAWTGYTNQHPVIATQLYRLKDGRFEQIGMSWARHCFLALANDFCELGCIVPDPYTGDTLGVGCSHPSNSDLNGLQSRLGPRGQVNAFTGDFPYHFSEVPYPPQYYHVDYGRRLRAHDADLDPEQEGGGDLFMEVQQIAADDALAGNGTNNVSYRPVTSEPGGDMYVLSWSGSVVEQTPAICAWKVQDDSVQETFVQIPNEGLLILAAKVTHLGDELWHYEYALYNMNSDRSGQSFIVPLSLGTSVANVGFHDEDHHSSDGDPYVPGSFSTTDWVPTVGPMQVAWATDTYDTDIQANALRWGTLYNFRFDADAPPKSGEVTIGLFKPGTPSQVSATTLVPDSWPPVNPSTDIPATLSGARAVLVFLFLAVGAALLRRRRTRPEPAKA
ncbi:MAG: hypothetical protein JXQ75_19285 [Phycisphaerae bacterium]|nr:hypothetical protein [Phycisphaerae bacterium]